MKKTFAIKKTSVILLIALLLLALVTGAAYAAVAGSGKYGAQAEKRLSFEGSIQEVEQDEVNMPIIYLHGNGSGSATTLGKFTMHFEGIVHNDANGVGTGVAGANYYTENGDVLFATLTGLGVPTNQPGVNQIDEKYTITGGTGRFVHASGNFAVERLLNLATGVSSGEIKGSILIH